MIILAYISSVLAALLSSAGQLFLKKAALKKVALTKNISLFIGGILFIIGLTASLFALRYLEFSTFYSITACNYIFIMLLSHLFLKEKIDRAKVIGIITISIGILIFNIF